MRSASSLSSSRLRARSGAACKGAATRECDKGGTQAPPFVDAMFHAVPRPNLESAEHRNMIDDDDERELIRLIRESRGYADFFETPGGRAERRYGEWDVAKLVCDFLVEQDDMQACHELFLLEPPEPDTVCHTQDGLRIGIEVTELIHPDALAQARRLKKQGQPITGLIANWTCDSVAQALADRIAAKDTRAANAHNRYNRILLAVHTDETMIDEALSRAAIASRTFTAERISQAFLVLSYRYGAWPVLRIPL